MHDSSLSEKALPKTMASDGGVSQTKFSYDVFLSFRGEDTRNTFTCHLYNELSRKGIVTFMDDGELQYGEELGPTLLKAINESRSSIVVFSENYASSSWCLKELVKIHECMKSKKQRVYPIFYKVDPSDVRHQSGSFGKAMAEHEGKLGEDSEDVKKWKSVLYDIANLKGEHLKEDQGKNESRFISDFVRGIFNKVSPKDLVRDEHIVGREYRVEELKSLIEIKSRNITFLSGIHGAGGIGKTTLAKALYDSIYTQFEASSFLSDIREIAKNQGLKHLEKVLSSQLLGRGIELDPIEEGTISKRFRLKRVLIVLDDVNNIDQLKSLAGKPDWFGDGSRIIVTTRYIDLLNVHEVKKRYEVKLLNDQESLELFCQSAFGKSCPESNYEDLCYRAMRCCKGLPLALQVLGSHLKGEEKDVTIWNDALNRYEKSLLPDVEKVLRISYDALPLFEKNIFLDVACFFKGQRFEYVKRVVHGSELGSGDGMRTLVKRSLLTVSNDQCLGMHDLIQDMGREIVKEKADNKVGQCSRLWHHEDVCQVLIDNMGSDEIQGIMLDPPQRKEIKCTAEVFQKMKNLRILIVRNTSLSPEPCYLPNNLRLLDWRNYPSQSFPSDFHPSYIGAFDLRGSPLLIPEKLFQGFKHLTYMNFSYCDMVAKFPDVSGAMNLRELRLDGCKNLVKIHESVGRLANLVFLSASECTQLKRFVKRNQRMYLPSLEYLSFNFCRKLAHFPDIADITGEIEKPLQINMIDTAIKELPDSIGNLTGLNYLEMTNCIGLEHLPNSLFTLSNFVTLKIGGCRQLQASFRRSRRCSSIKTLHFNNADLSDEDVHGIIDNFPNLEDLNVSWNNFVSIQACILKSTSLTSLNVSYCVKLKIIPELPPSVQKVDARHCNSLTPETSNILWSQVCKDMHKLEGIMMPKSEIPGWFSHVKEGGFPAIKIRGKFPAVALAFVFGEVNAEAKGPLPVHWRAVGMHLFIDGERRRYHNFTLAENHALLCDLRVLLSFEEWEDGSDDWKTIQVYCETELNLCSWGVYVYKQRETSMEDIQFMAQESTSSLFWSRLHAISEEEKVRNKIQSLNFTEIYMGYFMELKTRQQRGYYENKPPESLERDQMLLQAVEKMSRGATALTEGEGTSGLSMKDEEDKEIYLQMKGMAKIVSGDKGNSQGLVEEDSSSECESGNSPEDVEDLYNSNHDSDTHTADPTCLAILSILKKLFCFCSF